MHGAYVRNPTKGVPVVLWLCSLFAAYRVGFQVAPERAGTCKCFGVGSILGKIESKADGLAMILLLSMLFGGLVLLLWSRLKRNYSQTGNQTARIVTLIVGSFLLNCGFVHAQDSFTPLYSAEGLLELQVLNNSGKIVLTDEFPFKVSIDANGRWQMTRQTYVPKWSLTTTEFITYNGTDIYSVLYGDKHLDRDMKPVNNLPLEEHKHPARVCRGPFPVDHGSCAGLVWMAFLGGEYIARHPTNQIPNLLNAMPRTDPEAWDIDFQYKLLSKPGNSLIESGSFILDKTRLSPDLMNYPEIDEPAVVEEVEKFLQTIKRLKTAKSGEMTRSTYSLQQSEVVGNIRIPTQFSAMLYSPVGDNLGHYPVVKWDGRVTNIVTNLTPSQLLPPIKGGIYVQDQRFKQRTKGSFLNNIFYELDKTGWVLSTNDVRFKGAGFIQGLQKRQSIVLRRTEYFFILILFALLISLPVYLFARKLWGKNGQFKRFAAQLAAKQQTKQK